MRVDSAPGRTARHARRAALLQTVSSISASVTKKIIVAIMLTCGGIATRAAPQTNSGNVTVEPALKFVITKSSTDSANASSAAASTPGAISGSVTRMNVWKPLAPRSCAASSRLRSNPISRDRTVTTTKLMLNMMCAIRIVVKPVA